MFDGGYRVGVSVTPVEVLPWPAEAVPAGAVDRPSRLGEVLPVAVRADSEIAADLQRIADIEGALAAYRAELVVELGRRRPAVADHPVRTAVEAEFGVAPPSGVSEFFCDELALILNTSRTAAAVLSDQAATLLERLPSTWAALADGELDWPRARALAAELGRPADRTDPRIVAEVEAAVLPRAAGMSVRRLRDTTRRELLARDAAAADQRRRQAEKTADVQVRPLEDGMAELAAQYPAPIAAAMRDTVDQLAWMLRKDGDPRPIGVLRAEVLRDLVLRPWDSSRPAVSAHLDIVTSLAALSGGAGETLGRRDDTETVGTAEGEAITAAHLRELLAELDFLDLQEPPGSSCSISITDETGGLLGTATIRELRRLVRRGCPDHPASDCGCPQLEIPPDIDRYQPTPAQRRHVTTRDRTCRHPGCRNKAGWADLDHVVAHGDGGPTSCQNLCCLCRRHHRLKTHARGWTFRMDADGTLHVTTPSGVTRVTRPPGHTPTAVTAIAEDPPPF